MENFVDFEEPSKLELIVKESGLEQTKADIILRKFQDYFTMAADWERKAKTICVTNENQTDDMAMAKTGRKLLSARRIEIERTRKELKEQSLREGKAIDGIANVLKGLIVPIEEYLERQEKFLEFKIANEIEQKRLDDERKAQEAEQERLKAEAAEQAKIRAENEALRKEAAIRELKIAEERREQEKMLAAERAKAEAEKRAIKEAVRKQREEAEKKAADERKVIEDAARAEREKAEAARKQAEIKAAKEREVERAKAEHERKEKERLAEILKNTIKCPHCKKEFQLNHESEDF